MPSLQKFCHGRTVRTARPWRFRREAKKETESTSSLLHPSAPHLQWVDRAAAGSSPREPTSSLADRAPAPAESSAQPATLLRDSSTLEDRNLGSKRSGRRWYRRS